MKNRLLIIVMIIMAGVSFTNSKKAPAKLDFDLTKMEIIDVVTNKSVSIKPEEGKLLILDFWATWCGPCRMAIPKMNEIQKELGESVKIIGISVDRKLNHEDLKKFVKANNINYSVGFATKAVMKGFPGIRAIPTIKIISPEGNEIDQIVGFDPNMKYRVKGLLKKYGLEKKK